MQKVLLLGAGKIGGAIAKFLSHSGGYDVAVGDVDQGALDRISASAKVKTVKLNVSDSAALKAAMKDRQAVVSACSYDANKAIAEAALASGVSYFDLTEDVATTKAIKDFAARAKDGQIFMPQCGLAPGFICIVAHELSLGFERLDEVRMRVGALPKFPSNAMKYNLTWSTDGLINEYCNLCEAIHEGRQIDILPLEGLEHFSLDGIDYEAFNTSGGLGTLCESLSGKVRMLNYKTVRYTGHRDLMTFLVNGLRLSERRPILKDILEKSVPITLQDVVLIFCTVTGWRGGYLEQVTDARKIYHGEMFGEHWSAIQLTTSAALCAVLDLHAEGKLPTKGFVKQEQVRMADFLANRFGKHYSAPAS
ncbi:MAG: saccharopine dehydrogenase NADP-binding domain-containing protein [Planctomycetota bacterium]|nr:saccharopine dehydrogenase NADP-binding domain-containing protein [Planctomycetota bacterium]